jgi:hypothetical protein
MEMPHARYRAVLAAIVIVGLGAALLIFLLAGSPAANPLGEPGDSKTYVHDMLLYGGKTNMVMAEFMEWIGSLWHGKRMAITITVLTLLVAAAFHYFFAPLPDPDGLDGNGTNENDEA